MRGRLSGGAFNGANIRMFMYLYGSALFLWRDRVPMGAGILVALVAALVAASFDRTVFLIVYLLVMAPFVLHLAYVPGGRIRRFNELGDYSYGVYIYAFPIQQTLALLFPAMTLAAMMASSAAVSIAVAIVSWKLIEERALQPQERLRRRDQAAVQLRAGQARRGGALTDSEPREPLHGAGRSVVVGRRRSALASIGAQEIQERSDEFFPKGRVPQSCRSFADGLMDDRRQRVASNKDCHVRILARAAFGRADRGHVRYAIRFEIVVQMPSLARQPQSWAAMWDGGQPFVGSCSSAAMLLRRRVDVLWLVRTKRAWQSPMRFGMRASLLDMDLGSFPPSGLAP